MQEFVNQYKAQKAKEQADHERYEREAYERDTERNRANFAEIGLRPADVDGNNVLFVLDGEPIRLRWFSGEYEHGYVRLIGPCPKCGTELRSHAVNIGYIGRLFVDPEPRYHACEEPQAEQTQAEPVKSLREKLMDALDAYIQEQVYVHS